MIYMDDPFSQYPEFVKEKEKAKRLLDWEEGKKVTHGGWRPGAGSKPKQYKVFRASFTIEKQNEELVMQEINKLKAKYGYQVKDGI